MILPPSSTRTPSYWHSQAVPAAGHQWGREDSAPRLGVIVHYPSSIVKRNGCPLTAEEVFWQNVKRRPPQCPSSHQNTIGWIPRPFSGNSQNTHWHKFAPSVIIPTQPKSDNLPIRHQDSHTAHMMKPSDLLTRLTFQRTKPEVFAFHPPNIWLPWMKQYCLGSETILFDSSNTCVSHVKQYCLSLKM